MKKVLSLGFVPTDGVIHRAYPVAPIVGMRQIDNFGRVFVQTPDGRLYEDNPDKGYQHVITLLAVCSTLIKRYEDKGENHLNLPEHMYHGLQYDVDEVLVRYFLADETQVDTDYSAMFRQGGVKPITAREAGEILAHRVDSINDYLRTKGGKDV